MTNDISSEDSVIFLKLESALFCGKNAYELPNFTKEYHYETELAFRICKTGKDISTAQTFNYVDAFTIGIDIIARDLQRLFRMKGNYDNSKYKLYFADTGLLIALLDDES